MTYRSTKLLLAVALSLLLLTSCHLFRNQKPFIASTHLSKCRIVQHKLGEVCIPTEPRRIIALEPRYALDPLLAIGIVPIGFASYVEQGKVYTAGVPASQIANLSNVGRPDQPSFEKIARLNPDLILALDIQQNGQNYKLLSAIAPTVLIEYDKIKLSFKDNLRSLAQLFGQEERVEEIIEQYQQRIKKLRNQLSNQPQKVKISAISYENGSFYGYTNESGVSQVLADIGVSHKVVTSDNAEFSIELLDEYDADILFIHSVSEQAASIWRNPLISSLKAVKNQRAYFISTDSWWAYGPLGINQLLDDLEKYLIDNSR
jgi:iron complex transport system substrate-binding protein